MPLVLCACNNIQSEKTTMFYITVEELYSSHVTGDCGQNTDFEGKEVHVRGYLDRNNIFDKKSYPQLSYEKFKIYDKRSGRSIEVWASSPENSIIFEKIRQNAATPEKEVFISGVISSFDMPMMGKCRKGIKIELKNAANLFFN